MMAAPFPAAVALCWALSESPCQKSRALGWDVSHDHHENKAANQMAPEAVTQRKFLFFLCFKHCHSLFPGVNFPPSGAKQCSKSPAVLKRLKGCIYQKHFFFCYYFRKKNIFFERKKCNCHLRDWYLSDHTPRSRRVSENLMEIIPNLYDGLPQK